MSDAETRSEPAKVVDLLRAPRLRLGPRSPRHAIALFRS